MALRNGILISPEVSNIISDLPTRTDARYPSRNLSSIRQFIIHHSAIHNNVGPSRIAKVQVDQGKPGISYHFFIGGDGKIYQTNNLGTVSAHTNGHDQNSVAVCFAGNFTQAIPTEAQLTAGGRLLQTLLADLNLTVSAIKGASELVNTQSPGKQWLDGQRWKNRLVSAIPQETASTPAPQPGGSPTSPPNTDQITQLNTHIAQLTAQLAQAKTRQQASDGQIVALQAQLTQTQQQARTAAAESAARITVLQNQIAQLEADLRLARSGGTTPSSGTVAAPPIQNQINQLPRHPSARFGNRPTSAIDTLVIHHTAISERVGAARIAHAQVNQGQPGISYHYFIDSDGTISQTNEDGTATKHTAGFDQNGLAIAFAGNFTNDLPTEAQLQAGGQLIAYLQKKFNIARNKIQGASELVNTQSPGKQWLEGQRWKDRLLAQLGAGTSNGTPDVPQPGGNSAQIAALQARIAELELQLSIAQEAALSLDSGLTGVPAFGAGSVVSQPAIEDIVDELPRHPTKRYQSRSVQSIKTIIVHHSAVPAAVSADRIAQFNVNQNDWPAIGFHYFIGVDGIIYQTNDLTSIAYHAGGQNPTSVGVAFAGDFDEGVPTPAQITAGAHLIAWLLDHLSLSLTDLRAHKEFANTTCPGIQWDGGAMWRNSLMRTIQDNLAGAGTRGTNQEGKTIYHYMLFWQHGDNWAKSDLEGAMTYIGKFRPSLGFSIEDAIDAEYVTIVGGPLGVSSEDEARLKASGCQVERLAGNSERATQALLDSLAQRNKRFLRM